jgi:hypothetical protein
MATRNRIIYGSQSVWCNGYVLYRVQTLGSTTTFTSEDIFELGHLDIIDVVDDVPAVAVTLNTNDWGDVQTMAILAQVHPTKIAMDATATNTNANLAVVSGVNLDETGSYLHGACVADFAIVCGGLPGVSVWAPVQTECDLGTLAENVDQTMYMDEVFINSMEFSYTTGANATENYAGETDQKMWLLNDGRFVNWEAISVTWSGGTTSAVLGATPTTLTDGTRGFLRTDSAGARAVSVWDPTAETMTNVEVTTNGSAQATTFDLNAGTDTLYFPTTSGGWITGPTATVYALYAADAYAAATTSTYFNALDDVNRPEDLGAVRQGQVEIYLVSDSDAAWAQAWRLTGVTITADMTREPLTELGHLGPYDRPLTLPVPITVTVDATAGDLEHWSRFADRYSEYAAGTMDDINLSDLFGSEDIKLVVKVYAQTDEEAGGTGANRSVLAGSFLIGDYYFNNGARLGPYSASDTEYAVKTIIVEHLKITDEAYTLDLGTNATQTFGFRSTNDLYVVKGDLPIAHLTSGHKIRRNA